MTHRTHPCVLVGVDGSEQSLAALDLAAAEAKRRHHPLRIVSAYQWTMYTYTGMGPMAVPVTASEPAGAAKTILEQAAEATRTRHPEIQIMTEAIEGGAAAALVRESASASLLVVGNRGLGGFTGMLAGSVATQVASHSRCPVIVVRPGADTSAIAATTHPVVVGVDGIERTQPAVEFAFEEAASRGVSLTAIHVWAEPPRSGDDQFKPVAYDYDEAHREATRTLAEALAGYQEKYPDVPVFREVVCSLNPAEQLLRVTKEAGLIVVGSRGRGGFSGLLLGSVGQALIHHADCPVAVVRTGQ